MRGMGFPADSPGGYRSMSSASPERGGAAERPRGQSGQRLRSGSSVSSEVSSSCSSTSNVSDPRVELWQGPAVFVSHLTSDPAPSRSPQAPRAGQDVTTPAKASGSADSPISIGSSPSSPPHPAATRHSDLARPRAVPAYSSPTSRTAYTPPRARTLPFPAVSGPSPSTSRSANTRFKIGPDPPPAPVQSAAPKRDVQVHPFFTRDFARSESAPIPRAVPPAARRPRMVATYSSTSASGSQSQSQTASQETGASDSTFGSQPRADDAGLRQEMGDLPLRGAGHGTSGSRVKATDAVVETAGAGRKGKGKLMEWEIQEIIQQVERVDLTGKFWRDRDASGKSAGDSSRGPPCRSGEENLVPDSEMDRPGDPSTSLSGYTHKYVASAAQSTLHPPPKGDQRLPLPPDTRRPTTPPLPRPLPPNLPFFTFRNHPSRPSMAYTTDPTEANDLLSCLRGPVLGLDLEWPVAGKHTVVAPDGSSKTVNVGMRWDVKANKYVFGQGRTALVQVCDERLIVLVHLKDMKALPSKVIDIMQDTSTYKTGVQIKGDGAKLLRDFPTAFPRGIANLLELSYVAKTVDPVAVGPGNRLIGLATLCQTYMHLRLSKEANVRRSNWMTVLSDEQKEYAANDVYASLQIYLALNRLGEERGVTIDLPSCSHSITPGGHTYITSHGPTLRSPTDTKAETLPGTAQGDNAHHPENHNGNTPGSANPKGPTPAQHRALTSFQAGMSFAEIAEAGGIRETTIQSYVMKALEILPGDTLEDFDKRRLVDGIPSETYAGKAYRKALRRMGGS